MTAAVAVGCSLLDTYLLRCGHKVDGRVVAVVFLRQAEGELVVDEERVCLKPAWEECGGDYKKKQKNNSISLV